MNERYRSFWEALGEDALAEYDALTAESDDVTSP